MKSVKGKLKVFVKPLKKIRNATVVLVGGTYIISGIGYGFGNVNKTLERDYYEIVYDTDDLFEAVSNSDLENINYNALKNITSLRIDMSNSNYFNNLKYFNRLNKIEICNSQLLTDKDIELLNSLPLDEISLYFDRNYVLKNINNKFDLNRFRDKKIIKNITFNSSKASEEIDGIILLQYLDNYEYCNVEFIKYELINNSLDKVINDLDLSDRPNDFNNLLKIVHYVSKHVHYDQEILEYTKEHSYNLPTTKLYWKLLDYNNKSISKVVSNLEDYDKAGICTNYADFTLALCIKANICCNSVSGKYNDAEHSWNVVDITDYSNELNPITDTYYLDTTWFDTKDDLKHTTEEYLNNTSNEDLIDLKNSLLISRDAYLCSSYSINREYNSYFTDELDKNTIDNIYGTRVNQLRVFGFNALYSLLVYEGLTGLYAINQYMKKRNMIKELKPDKSKKKKDKVIEEIKINSEVKDEKKEKVKSLRKVFKKNKKEVKESNI